MALVKQEQQLMAFISSLFLKEENPFPVVLHADNDPALLCRFVVQGLGESADLRVRQPQRRTVRIFSLRIVVKHEHRESFAITGFRVFQHLPVASRVAERGIRPASDHHVDAFGLASIVVVQEKFRVSGKKWPAVLVVAVADAGYGAHHLLGWNAVYLLREDPYEILPPRLSRCKSCSCLRAGT